MSKQLKEFIWDAEMYYRSGMSFPLLPKDFELFNRLRDEQLSEPAKDSSPSEHDKDKLKPGDA